MENEIFGSSLPTTDLNYVAFNGVTPSIFSSPLTHSGVTDGNSHGQIVIGNPLYSTVQEDVLNSCYISNYKAAVSGETTTSGIILHAKHPCEGLNGHTDLRENLCGTSLPATSVVNLLPSTTSLRENLLSFGISSPSALTSDMRTFMSRGCYNYLISPYLSQGDCGYGAEDGAGYDESLLSRVPSGRAVSTVRPSYNMTVSSQPVPNLSNSNLKSDHSDNYCVPRNELSLTLGSHQPSIIDMPDIPDQCSKISCSGSAQITPEESSSCLRHPSQGGWDFNSREEFSPHCDPSSPAYFSHVHIGSRYLCVAQKILAELANYALDNSDEVDDSLSGFDGEERMSLSSSCSTPTGFSLAGRDEFPRHLGENKNHKDIDQPLLRNNNKEEKDKLLNMLQMIDLGYNQCLDQIQSVMTAFQSATSAGIGIPQVHARFSLHKISTVYQSLRERICSQIILASHQQHEGCSSEKEKYFESAFIHQKQWALQQVGRSDHQSWRPQRGLPERSVTVLRAWMFRNFLHPYPKDSDKHLLAIRSGLTRSQVSNWFINARVRLWKPMIEEMHSEIVKKHQTEPGVEGGCGSHGNISNQKRRS